MQINTPKELDELFYEIVSNNPEIRSTEAAQLMIQRNAHYAYYLYRRRQKPSLTMGIKSKLLTIKNNAQGIKYITDHLVNHDIHYELDSHAFTRMKNRLNRSGKVIFGSSSIGYVALKNMNFDRAARWSYPRLKQRMHESMHWDRVSNIMTTQAISSDDKKLAKAMMLYLKSANNYEALKAITKAIADRS